MWGAFTCSLSKRVLKQSFLESGLTKFFTVCNFGNTLAMTSIFFSTCLKFDVDSRNRTKNLEKVFFSKIIAFELAVANFRNLQQDTCNPQSMC